MHFKCHQESPKLHKIPSYWKHFFCWHSSESLKKISTLDTCVAGLWVIFIFVCFCNFKNLNYSPQCIFNQIGVRLDTHTHIHTIKNIFFVFLLLLFSCSVVSDYLQTPWTATHQGSLSFTISQSLLRLMSNESMMPLGNFMLPRLWVILCYPDS